ncbi:hypothetical protein AWB82_01485 [Caballeronia glebae]|uniref:Uncharacterized protein n=1 Tax=Caballeronia glebae TaxID=1777143 RepID=A0A157ZZS7_9BURK|nr:hypothetical protein [Caballeronia glebae]SAK51054.1 hypothetical protein AWB82_01485 [Caballeronia glebae]
MKLKTAMQCLAPSNQRHWEPGEYRQLAHELTSFMEWLLSNEQSPPNTSFVRRCDQWMDLYWPGYAYSPDWQLFFDCFARHPLGEIRLTAVSAAPMAMQRDEYLFSDFANQLRTAAVLSNLRKRLWERHDNLRVQAESISTSLQTLRAADKRLLPLRLDLFYGESSAFAEDAMPRHAWGAFSKQQAATPHAYHPVWEVRARVDIAQAIHDRERFFGNRMGQDADLFDGLVDYICKTETGGEHHANHHHCLLFFDADRVNASASDRKVYLVQDRWSRVTGGCGVVFDCRNRGDVEKLRAEGRWALDPLEPGDEVQYARLERYVVGYFAKDDGQMLRVKPTAKARALTMGQYERAGGIR